MNDGTPWLDDDEADAWLALVSVLGVLPAALDSQLMRDADLTFFEFLVLAQLADVEGESIRLSDLAASLNTTLPRLSRVIAQLEKDGLVVRRTSAADARSRQAHLTDRGRERLDAAMPGHVELVQRIFVGPLTREQLGQVRRIGDRLLAGLDPGRRVLAGSKGPTRDRQGFFRAPIEPRAGV